MKRYAGNRDPRFVAIHRGGVLDLTTHRLLVAWAADCAEHVLPLFTEVHPTDTRPSHTRLLYPPTFVRPSQRFVADQLWKR
jgi:hypothetical protein